MKTGTIEIELQKIAAAATQAEILRKRIDETQAGLRGSKAEANGLSGAIQQAGAQARAVDISAALRQLSGQLNKMAAAMASHFGQMAHSMEKSTTGALAAVEEKWWGMWHAVRRSLPAQKLAETAQTALGTIRQALTDGLQANRAYAASWAEIQTNIRNMVAPVVEFALPALLGLLNVLQRVTAAASAFVAMLFGKRVQQTSAVAAGGYTKQAKAIGSVGKAAEKAGKFLHGFDEISQNAAQNDPAPSGGSGGGSGGAALPFPEKKPLLIGWIEELREKLEGLSGFAWGFAIGKALGEQLAKMLDIDWAPIQAKAVAIALRIAGLFAGLTRYIPWESIGYNLAEGLNTVLLFISTWWERTPWGELGQNMAKGLNKMVKTIDWKLLGKTLALQWKSLIDWLYTFVNTFDWKAFGASIARSVNSWFATIDWEKTGKALSDGVRGILDMLLEAIRTLDWQQIGRDIRTFLEAIEWDEIFASVGDVLREAGAGLWALLREALREKISETQTDLQERLQTAGIAAVTGLLEGLAELPQKAQAIFTNLWGLLEQTCREKGAEIQLFLTETWNAIGATATEIWLGITSFFADTWNAIGNTATEVWNGIQRFVTEVWQGIQTTATEIWTALKDFLSGLWQGIKTTATEKFTAIRDVVTGMFTTAKDKAVTIWEGIKEKITTIITALKESFSETFTAIKEGVVEAFDGMWNGIKGTIDTIISGIEKMANGVIKGVNSIIGALNGLSFEIPKTKWTEAMSVGLNIPLLGEVSIPRLARGGVVQGARLAMIGEDGAEAVVPLERNTAWIRRVAAEMAGQLAGFQLPASYMQAIVAQETRAGYGANTPTDRYDSAQAVADAIAAATGGQGAAIEVPLTIGGQEFGRAVLHYGRQEEKRRGKQFSDRLVMV